MKKLFTLFAMLTLAVSVMAQTINYQAVLRDNTDSSLVRNQTGTAVVTVLRVDMTIDTLYNGPFTTNASGMTNFELKLAGPQAEAIEIGESNIPVQTNNPNQTISDVTPVTSDVTPVQPVKPAQIDWRNNKITAVFTYGDNKTIKLVTPVTAVPYAAQAKDADLTTSTVVTYINRADDMERIWTAVKGNEDLHNAMRDSIANFLKQKENYEYAKEILYSYISQVTAADLNEAYEQLQELSQETKNAIDTALKNFLKSNRNLAIEVAEYYAQTATEDEMRTIYNDLKANEPAATKIKELMDQYFAHYLAYKGLVCMVDNENRTLCDAIAAMNAELKCLEISKEGTNFSENACLYYKDGDTYQNAFERPENHSGELKWGTWPGNDHQTLYYKEDNPNYSRDLYVNGDHDFLGGDGHGGTGTFDVTWDTVINPENTHTFGPGF